jgi:RNA polymerase sigma factor (TIGR02999 family)
MDFFDPKPDPEIKSLAFAGKHWYYGDTLHNFGFKMSEELNKAEITQMLKVWGSGDQAVDDEFVRLVYNELRQQAHRFLRQERSNHTLQTTALVHEAYLRLAEQKHVDWQNRNHFFGLAAQMMRRILVNYAVHRNRQKRGGAEENLPLEQALMIAGKERDVDLIELDKALNNLENLDARQARIVELRYFSGLSIEETAEVMKISAATVKRDWQMAKAWLKAEIAGN